MGGESGYQVRITALQVAIRPIDENIEVSSPFVCLAPRLQRSVVAGTMAERATRMKEKKAQLRKLSTAAVDPRHGGMEREEGVGKHVEAWVRVLSCHTILLHHFVDRLLQRSVEKAESGTETTIIKRLNITLSAEEPNDQPDWLRSLDDEMIISLRLLLEKIGGKKQQDFTWPQLVGVFMSTPSLVEERKAIQRDSTYYHTNKREIKMSEVGSEDLEKDSASVVHGVRQQFDLR